MTRLGPVLVLVCALGIGGWACGSDDPGEDVAQPRTEAPDFGSGAFDEIPRYPGSSELTPAREQDGALAQSFLIEMETPEAVLTYYRDQLAEEGWEQSGAIEQLSDTSFRGDWRRDRLLLEVSAGNASTIDEEVASEQVTTQYSLVLRDADTAEDVTE